MLDYVYGTGNTLISQNIYRKADCNTCERVSLWLSKSIVYVPLIKIAIYNHLNIECMLVLILYNLSFNL